MATYISDVDEYRKIAKIAIDEKIPLVIFSDLSSPDMTEYKFSKQQKASALLHTVLSSDVWHDYMNEHKNDYCFVFGSKSESPELFSLLMTNEVRWSYKYPQMRTDCPGIFHATETKYDANMLSWWNGDDGGSQTGEAMRYRAKNYGYFSGQLEEQYATPEGLIAAIEDGFKNYAKDVFQVQFVDWNGTVIPVKI